MLRKLLFKLFAAALFLGFLLCVNSANAQTATFAALTGGLQNTATAIAPGTSQVPLIGFSVSVSGGSISFKQYNLSSNFTSGTYLANGTLFRSSTSSFSSSSPGTPVGNVTFNGTSITVDNFTETISSSAPNPTYYFLVADIIYSGGSIDYNGQVFINNANFATDINGSTSYSFYGNYRTYTWNTGTGYSLRLNNLTGGLSSTSTTLLPSTTDVAVYGFSITTTASYSFSNFRINSNLSSLSSYFSAIRLYRCTGSTYSVATRTLVATGTMSGGYVTMTPGTAQAVNNTTRYYFLVVDVVSSLTTLPATIQFNVQNGQTNNALTRTSPSGNFNQFTNFGNTYTFNTANLTITPTTGLTGLTTGTITARQTGVVLFGFTMTKAASGDAVTISGFNINSTLSNVGSYFGNAKLFYSADATYTAGAETQAGTVTFSGGYAVVAMTAENTFTTTAQTRYYFLVADNTSAAVSTTVQFNFANGQSSAAVTQSSPVSSTYNNFSGTGNTLTLPAPTAFVNGANSVSTNGISTGDLYYGRKDIVLFGFSVEAFGAPFVFNTNSIKFNSITGSGENGYFTNARLYRSTGQKFPGGTPLYTSSSISVTGGGYFTGTGLTESVPTGTTYYYWLVVDYTTNWGSMPASFTCSFTSGQGQKQFVTTSPYAENNSYSVTSGIFNIALTQDWTGGNNSNFNNAANYTLINGGGGSVPGASTIVRIGGVAFTNTPDINTDMTIGGLTIESTYAVTLTGETNKQLTLNKGLNLSSGANFTLNSGNRGGIILANGSISSVASTARLTLANKSVIDNSANTTGSFTFKSDASGTGALAEVPTSCDMLGNYTVERYVSGGSSSNRGYRLFSSPVYEATVSGNRVYGVAFTKNSAYTTGTTGTGGGFDATSSTPTIYLYREDKTASTSPTGGNFRGVNAINNSPSYNLSLDNETGTFNLPVGNGFMFFFRGNRATNASTTTSVIPDAATFSQTGALTYGDVQVRSWYNIGSTTKGRVNTRFHLVGNPYVSTIDWDTFSSTSAVNAIFGPNISNTIYTYNPTAKTYATYDGVSGTNNGTRYIPSGQGFFVLANTSGTAALKFTEAAKAATQVVTPNLLMAKAKVVEKTAPQYLKLQLAKDAINKEDMVVRFNKSATTNYLFNEDSPYFQGSSAVNLYSKSADNVNLSINELPFSDKTQVIPVYANVNATGLYKLTLTELNNIPQLFDIWLKDAFTNDSLDLRNNSTYNFNAVTTNAATYGAGRFSLVIRPNAAYSYRLLSFKASRLTNNVNLTWTTENEKDFTFFTLERSTDGGKNFDIITSVKSSDLATYSFLDRTPSTGENLYRLKQENYFGKTSYSDVVTVMFTSGEEVVKEPVIVFPNPVSSTINVSVMVTGATKTANFTITIVNSTGRVVKTVDAATSEWQGNVSDLMPGTYFVRVLNNTSKRAVGTKTTFIKL